MDDWSMVILGIDPGTARIGYGLIEKEAGKIRFCEAGLLPIRAKVQARALVEIKTQMDALIRKWHPEILATEKLYLVRNQKTGMSVAEARGVILLAAAEQGLTIREYGPRQVKSGVTGYGDADKAAVLKMVRIHLREPSLAIIDDASDALALAIMATGRD